MPRKLLNKYRYLSVVGWFWVLILKLKIKTLIEKQLHEKLTVENGFATNRIEIETNKKTTSLSWWFGLVIKEASSCWG